MVFRAFRSATLLPQNLRENVCLNHVKIKTENLLTEELQEQTRL